MHLSADANQSARSTGPFHASHVDFIIIGAQKCGTTSLFEYLRPHPQVYMPPQKEIGFFSSDASYARGLEAYRSIMALDSAPAGAVCGEASVAYMSGTSDQRPASNGVATPVPDDRNVREELIPRRIKEHLPDVKLISVLRDPVSRCLSHYRMMVLTGAERRPFEQVVSAMLEPEELEHARSSITGSNGYIVRGEYFRILSGYLRTFPPEQLLVLFTSELESRPAAVLKRVFEFIGVDTGFIPDNLGVRYREAAVSRRVPGLDLYCWQDRLSRARVSRTLWHTLPMRGRVRIARLYEDMSLRAEIWNARRGSLDGSMPNQVREQLMAHFWSDGEALATALGAEVPWLADWNARPDPHFRGAR